MKLKLTAPLKILEITPGFQIPLDEIHFSYVRSSGPGGQNVNKVNSKAVLSWNLSLSPSVPEKLRVLLKEKLQSHTNKEGCVILSSDQMRDQLKNKGHCLQKLRLLLVKACFQPKKRKKTKPSFSSQEKVKHSKRLHSLKKKNRKMDSY